MNTVFISLDNAAEGVDVGYEIKWRDPWEPFFISPRTAPDYDERFKQVRTSIHNEPHKAEPPKYICISTYIFGRHLAPKAALFGGSAGS